MIKICTDIKQARQLWKKFSPQATLWDSWNTAQVFHDDIKEVYFLYSEQGVLPLCYEQEKKRYTFFGSSFLENMKFWFPLEEFPAFFEKIPPSTVLFDLNGEEVDRLLHKYPEYDIYFKRHDHRYLLRAKDFSSYLLSFSKKHRKNLVYDLKALEKLNYTITYGGVKNIPTLFDFNVLRFGSESDYHDHLFRDQVMKFCRYLQKKKYLLTVHVKLNKKVEGIMFAAVYNNVCYVINSGYNPNIKNLGKLLIVEMIKKAFSLGCKEIDFLVGDTGWKELWNLEKEKCYTFER